MGMTVLEFVTKFNQLILFVVNVFVAVLGVCVMIVGSWAQANSKQYFVIADEDNQYTQVAVLLIVVGIFILLIGILGAVGALFASKVFGRIILIVYAIGLGLLVVCEMAGGITAAVAKNAFEGVFRDSANETFILYYSPTHTSERDTWDQFQKNFHCCGVESYKDYINYFGNLSVPTSCCDTASIKLDDQNCSKVVEEVFKIDTNSTEYIYTTGCAETIIDDLKHNLGAIAASAIIFALLQIIGIVLACFVAMCKRDKTYEVV